MHTSCFCDFGSEDENRRGFFYATCSQVMRKKEENQKSKTFLYHKFIIN